MLQLANGQSILLDTMQNGTVIIQENLRIVKEDGKLRYEATDAASAALASLTNTISTPVGRKWNLQLPDGSTVWLNSESAITYPLAFNGTERKVQMSGEAYFDIVHNDRAPFRVQAGTMLIEDLGTAFNVNAYTDNAKQYVTLVEGLAQVRSSNTGVTNIIDLKPGQQAEASIEGKISLNREVNVEDVIAWKNGQFKFSEGTINEVMSAAARWYGLTVTYEGSIKEHFVLNLSRDLPLSALLEILESTGSVRFEISGKQVKVIAVQ
jgi:ferric-dicitrate binding protein FerR (iron transport regulator)